MSKLFTLREWLPIDDASNYLSNVFNEKVSVSDILTLALEGRIGLSIRFESSLTARLAKSSENEPSGKYLKDYVKAKNGGYFSLNSKIEYIDEIFDLPMIGGERECIRSFEWHDNLNYEWALTFDEIFVQTKSGELYVLVENKEPGKFKENYTDAENYRFLYGMPEGGRIVVKTGYLRALVESVQRPATKELSGTSERTYKNIIGAMLELLKNHRPGRVDDAAIIRELVANYGDKYGISESNLNRKLPEAKRILNAD